MNAKEARSLTESFRQTEVEKLLYIRGNIANMAKGGYSSFGVTAVYMTPAILKELRKDGFDVKDYGDGVYSIRW